MSGGVVTVVMYRRLPSTHDLMSLFALANEVSPYCWLAANNHWGLILARIFFFRKLLLYSRKAVLGSSLLGLVMMAQSVNAWFVISFQTIHL